MSTIQGLPGDVVALLNEKVSGLGTSINGRLAELAQFLDQDTVNAVTYTSAVDMEGNRVTGVAKPTAGSDLISFQTLKDHTTGKKLSEILSECVELENQIEQDVEFTGGAEWTAFFGFCVYNPLSVSIESPNVAANDVLAWEFVLPGSITVTRVIFEVVGFQAGKSISIGLYDAAKNIVINTGVQSAGANGVFAVPVPTTRLTPGLYFLGYTSDGTPSMRCSDHSGIVNITNQTAVRMGKNSAGSSGAVLPSTLGTLTSGSRNPPLALFEI